MARSSVGEEFVQHVVGIRMRVTGIGTLNLGLESYNNVRSVSLDPLILQSETEIEPTKLANFQSQRIRWTLEFDTSNPGRFQISRIILFAKAVATEFPM